jgi:hypothetical protein
MYTDDSRARVSMRRASGSISRVRSIIAGSVAPGSGASAPTTALRTSCSAARTQESSRVHLQSCSDASMGRSMWPFLCGSWYAAIGWHHTDSFETHCGGLKAHKRCAHLVAVAGQQPKQRRCHLVLCKAAILHVCYTTSAGGQPRHGRVQMHIAHHIGAVSEAWNPHSSACRTGRPETVWRFAAGILGFQL